MKLIQRLLRRSIKPAIMVGIAGSLAVSLVVTTPSNAQAFVAPPLIPVVAGATEMAIPTLMATSSVLGPVGWTIAGVTALGIGLYATKDYWLPYVSGLFGKSDPACPAGSYCGSGGATGFGGATYAEPAMMVKSVALNPTNPLIVQSTYAWTNTGSSTGYTAIMQVLAQCRNNTTGAIAYGLKTTTQGQPNRTQVREQMFEMQPCPAGNTMTGYMVGGGYPTLNADGSVQTFTPNVISPYTNLLSFNGNSSSGSGTHGPTNILSYGYFAPADINPRTDATKYVTTVECIKPDGQLVNISAESLGGAGGLTVPSCAAAGLGHGTGKMGVDGYLNGSTTKTDLWDATAPTPSTEQPLCAPTRAQPGCKLAVKIDGKECAMGVTECVNWSDLNKDPNWSPRISCQYGPYSVATALCNPLEQAYEPGGAPATDPNVDGNPDTRSDTQPDGTTQPRPNTGTSTGTIPGVGGEPGPSSSPNEAECFPQGWAAFNPLEWVMKPVGCALEWAFVPDPVKVETAVQGVKNSWSQTPMAKVSGMVGSITAALPAGSGCSGISFTFPGVLGVAAQNFSVLNACTDPVATVAGIVRTVGSIGMIIGGVLALTKIAGGVIALPGLGKSGDS